MQNWNYNQLHDKIYRHSQNRCVKTHACDYTEVDERNLSRDYEIAGSAMLMFC